MSNDNERPRRSPPNNPSVKLVTKTSTTASVSLTSAYRNFGSQFIKDYLVLKQKRNCLDITTLLKQRFYFEGQADFVPELKSSES